MAQTPDEKTYVEIPFMICAKEGHFPYSDELRMKPLESLWQETKQKFDKLEKALVDDYIAFLREVARIYIEQSRRVFFRENQFVHWGEGNFGSLLIEGDEKVDAVFGDYISEIRFESEINEKITEGYIEIKKENIEDISYQIL